jgi:hypothetical protein
MYDRTLTKAYIWRMKKANVSRLRGVLAQMACAWSVLTVEVLYLHSEILGAVLTSRRLVLVLRKREGSIVFYTR